MISCITPLYFSSLSDVSTDSLSFCLCPVTVYPCYLDSLVSSWISCLASFAGLRVVVASVLCVLLKLYHLLIPHINLAGLNLVRRSCTLSPVQVPCSTPFISLPCGNNQANCPCLRHEDQKRFSRPSQHVIVISSPLDVLPSLRRLYSPCYNHLEPRECVFKRAFSFVAHLLLMLHRIPGYVVNS